mgnify:CR=1 FL=1
MPALVEEATQLIRQLRAKVYNFYIFMKLNVVNLLQYLSWRMFKKVDRNEIGVVFQAMKSASLP